MTPSESSLGLMTKADNILLQNKDSVLYGISYRVSKAYIGKDMQQRLRLSCNVDTFPHSLCIKKTEVLVSDKLLNDLF